MLGRRCSSNSGAVRNTAESIVNGSNKIGKILQSEIAVNERATMEDVRIAQPNNVK